MVPTAGLSDHVTAVLAVPITVAANRWDFEAVSETEVGPTKTLAV
jgi:hypothetical protein